MTNWFGYLFIIRDNADYCRVATAPEGTMPSLFPMWCYIHPLCSRPYPRNRGGQKIIVLIASSDGDTAKASKRHEKVNDHMLFTENLCCLRLTTWDIITNSIFLLNRLQSTSSMTAPSARTWIRLDLEWSALLHYNWSLNTCMLHVHLH